MIRRLFRKLVNAFKGFFLRKKLADTTSSVRNEAEEALARVIYETSITPDCVSAGEINGGCGIKVKHDDAHEWFVHETYDKGADEAITWIRNQQNDDTQKLEYISTTKTSKMNRAQRRSFDSKRKQKRKAARKSRKRA